MKNIMRILTLVAMTVVIGAAAHAQPYPQDFTKTQADSTIAFRRTEITQLQSLLDFI